MKSLRTSPMNGIKWSPKSSESMQNICNLFDDVVDERGEAADARKVGPCPVSSGNTSTTIIALFQPRGGLRLDLAHTSMP